MINQIYQILGMISFRVQLAVAIQDYNLAPTSLI